MVIEDFLAELQSRDVQLRVDGDRLRCSAPPGVLDPALQAELKRRKRELVDFLKVACAARVSRPKLKSIPRDQQLPLSFGQQRLWFLQRFDPKSSAYNIPAVIRHVGIVDVAILERSLTEIVRRHEVLRTTFAMADGQPVQIIQPISPVVIPVVDLSGLEEREQQVQAARLAKAEAQMPFDLSQNLPWRARLLRLAGEQHWLLFTMHHIVCDRWSLGLLLRELSVLMAAYAQGQVSPLPELVIQYADFAWWQRQWFQKDVLGTQFEYWKEQLGGKLPVLDLPIDHPRPNIQTERSAIQQLVLAGEISEAIRELSHRQGVTLFMTLVAVLKTLLHRYTGQTDLILGTPISDRRHVETEELIGFFLNTLVLRTDFSGNPSFVEVLRRVRDVALGAYDHQELPFEKLVEELQPERDLSRSPLFQVMFVLQNVPKAVDVTGVQGLSFSANETTMFDLSLELMESEAGLTGHVTYNADLFDDATMTRFVAHFRNLLEGIVATPERRISDLPILTEAEQLQLRVDFNPPAARVSAALVPQLFEVQAARQPNAIAVVFDDLELTYGELNRRTNQLSRHLRSLGVGPHKPVLVYLQRSVDAVIALLAILKAGGVYVPIDVGVPKERVAFVLEDTKAWAVITRGTLFEVEWPRMVCLETEAEAIARQEPEDLPGFLNAENLAYLIHTSGSTGRPKGVMVSHGVLAEHCRTIQSCFELSPSDRVLQFSSLGFDASLEQILSSLISGATVILRGTEVWLPSEFCKRGLRYGLTVADLPTSYCHELVQAWADAPEWSAITSLRLVITGGEAVPTELIEYWRRTPLGSVRLLNAYGPTEAAISTTLFEVPREKEHSQSLHRVPIGRPLPSKKVYLLDRHRGLVPVGVRGELFVGGTTLAVGYWNRPDLTAEHFVPDHLSGCPGARLYRSGDVARYLVDGNIEFLGREDDQLKVRGFRVEPGEIQAILNQHPAVSDSLVLLQPAASGELRLVAYIVMPQDSIPSMSELRNLASEKLPDYMIPAEFIRLAAFPLLPSGKVDRKALPPPATSVSTGRAFVAPRDSLELQLAKIWEKVLGRRPIGVTDNFFEVGGHSLLAVKLFSQIEKSLGKNLPLATLFQKPTIERLAETFKQSGWRAPWSSLVAIQPGGSNPPLFCVHGVGGNVLFCRELANHLGPDQPFYGLQSLGLDVNKVPHDRIEPMAAHYLSEVRSLQPEGPYFLGGFCMGGMVAFEMARRLDLEGQKVGLVALLETHGPGYFLDPKDNVQFFYEDRTLWQRIKTNLQKLATLQAQERKVLIQKKVELLRNNIEMRWTELASKMLLFFGHPTLAALQRVHQSNVHAQICYVPQSVYPGRVHLFQADKQPLGTYKFDPQFGWGHWAAQGVEIHEFPGYHGTFMQEPYVAVFAEKLKGCLRTAQQVAPEGGRQ